MASFSALVKVLLLGAVGVLLCVWVVENPQDSLVSRLVTYDKVWVLLLQHLYLVAASALLAVVTAVPLGSP